MKRKLDLTSLAWPTQASALSNVAIIRLFLLEHDLEAGTQRPPALDLAELQAAVNAARAHSPTSSFMWLTDLWLRRLRGEPADGNSGLLRMSYLFGPNEAWIAIRRNPLALSLLPSVPTDLAEQAISEFVGLVRSGLYAYASRILSGPGWPMREQLVGRLAHLDEADRRRFAKALAADNVGVSVPGVDERPSRPF